MKKETNYFKLAFWICLAVSLILGITGFFLPPTGKIDGSVLTMVGEFLGFAVVAMLPELISKTKSTKVSTPSGASIEIETQDKDGEGC